MKHLTKNYFEEPAVYRKWISMGLMTKSESRRIINKWKRYMEGLRIKKEEIKKARAEDSKAEDQREKDRYQKRLGGK